MYRCNDCGRLFDEPRKGEQDAYTGDCYIGCPHCGSDDYVEGNMCACGEWCADEDMCDDCKEAYWGVMDTAFYAMLDKHPSCSPYDILCVVTEWAENKEALSN